MERLACLIVGRNLGDAVIQSDFFNKLAASGYAENYLVWTRPQVAFLFEGIPNCKVLTSQFPVGTTKNFGWAQAVAFLKAAWTIRGLQPSVTIDLIGDIRERWFGHLAGGLKHKHIGWAKGHPFNMIIRNPFGRGDPVIEVPRKVFNVYDAYSLMFEALTGIAVSTGKKAKRRRSPLHVGLHPFASQECKLWPESQWAQLVKLLLLRDISVTVFGAPNDLPALQRIFREVWQDITVVTNSIKDFMRELGALDLFVGLDSFGVHAAHREGVKSVLLMGGNDPEMWTPPSSTLIARSGNCKYYPCYNVPKCAGTAGEYACIKSINVDDTLKAILEA